MAVDKSLMEAPQGIAAMAAEMEPIEIEIVDPEEVRIGVDGMLIEFEKAEPRAEDFDANLAEYMNENELGSLAGELLGNYEQDLSSRKDWLDTYVKGLKILGMQRFVSRMT
ncbi:MAG: hypothetical protein EB010_11955 [Acidimicrobiia bacterium]|nr:hypothetical protein [Acidimicrobiia bacterium]